MQNNRPTSPHLQIYQPQLTSILSIVHRFSGIALYLGILLVLATVSLAIINPTLWDNINDHSPVWLDRLIYSIISAAATYHWLNGIRHLAWDKLIGLNLKQVYQSGYFVLILFVVIYSSIWYLHFTF